MTKYLETINPLIKEYYDILSEDFPEYGILLMIKNKLYQVYFMISQNHLLIIV